MVVPIWVTGDDSELNKHLVDALERVTPKLCRAPAGTLLGNSVGIDGALVVAGFSTIDKQVQRIIKQWERDLGQGRLLVFASEEGQYPRRVFSWQSVDENSLKYLVESELEQIEMRTRVSLAETERLAALHMSAELISGMAHDLRAPLNSIIGFAQLLESEAIGPLNQKQNRYVTNIALSGRTLLRLIDDIVDLSRIDTGKLGLEMESIELAAFVEDAIRPLRERAQKRGVTFVVDSMRKTAGTVYVDRRRFRRALHLLLSFQVESGVSGERLVISVNQDGTGPRLRMELEGKADERFAASETAAVSTQTTWKRRYVARVLEMHGAKLVGWENDADGRRPVEVHLPQESDNARK